MESFPISGCGVTSGCDVPLPLESLMATTDPNTINPRVEIVTPNMMHHFFLFLDSGSEHFFTLKDRN